MDTALENLPEETPGVMTSRDLREIRKTDDSDSYTGFIKKNIKREVNVDGWITKIISWVDTPESRRAFGGPKKKKLFKRTHRHNYIYFHDQKDQLLGPTVTTIVLGDFKHFS